MRVELENASGELLRYDWDLWALPHQREPRGQMGGKTIRVSMDAIVTGATSLGEALTGIEKLLAGAELPEPDDAFTHGVPITVGHIEALTYLMESEAVVYLPLTRGEDVETWLQALYDHDPDLEWDPKMLGELLDWRKGDSAVGVDIGALLRLAFEVGREA